MFEQREPFADLESFLRLMPKAELHCHLLGTVRRATFEALARQAQAPLAAAESKRSTRAARSRWACCACCARSMRGC